MQTPDMPLFAEDLTRARLGTIPNLNDQVAPEAWMTSGPNSHMVVMGAVTNVWCPPDKFIELAPNLKVEGFKPVSVAVWEDGVRTQAHGLDEFYTLRVNPPLGGVNRKRVNVILYDARGNAQSVMQCTVRSHIANPIIAALHPTRHNEQCGFEIQDRQMFTNACLYLGDIYMGRVGNDAGKVAMDERLLPPGRYSCQIVGTNVDGILVPGVSSEFTVPARYRIRCENEGQQRIVIGEHDDEKLTVSIAHARGLSIVKTRVYIAGIKAGEKVGDDFTINLPLRNVPSGNCFIEVIGVGEDGVTYPVEGISVTIKNEAWEQRLLHTPEYEQIVENKAQINKLWQEVCANLERARYEPSIYNDSTTFTLFSITEHYAVGKSAEYQAAAKTAFIRITQLQLQTARLYLALKMRGKASSLFARVISELGDASSADKENAKQALTALRTEPTTAP